MQIISVTTTTRRKFLIFILHLGEGLPSKRVCPQNLLPERSRAAGGLLGLAHWFVGHSAAGKNCLVSSFVASRERRLILCRCPAAACDTRRDAAFGSKPSQVQSVAKGTICRLGNVVITVEIRYRP